MPVAHCGNLCTGHMKDANKQINSDSKVFKLYITLINNSWFVFNLELELNIVLYLIASTFIILRSSIFIIELNMAALIISIMIINNSQIINIIQIR